MTLGMVEVESGERWARQEPLTRWLGARWRQWGCFIKAVCTLHQPPWGAASRPGCG